MLDQQETAYQDNGKCLSAIAKKQPSAEYSAGE
jgi:hypothetical protein